MADRHSSMLPAHRAAPSPSICTAVVAELLNHPGTARLVGLLVADAERAEAEADELDHAIAEAVALFAQAVEEGTEPAARPALVLIPGGLQ